jgi:hypothetical protein
MLDSVKGSKNKLGEGTVGPTQLPEFTDHEPLDFDSALLAQTTDGQAGPSTYIGRYSNFDFREEKVLAQEQEEVHLTADLEEIASRQDETSVQKQAECDARADSATSKTRKEED